MAGKTQHRVVKLEGIQVLRAVAVLMVIISHSAHEIKRMLASRGLHYDDKFFPGDFGVDLFFVISGFIMVYTCWDQFQKKGASARFISRRLIRIVPLYWVATSLMIAIVIAMPGAVNTATNDVGQWVSSYLFWPYAREGDGMIRPVLGLGWSLQYEMLFYVIFAAALLLPRKIGLDAVVVALALCVGFGILGKYWFDDPPTFIEFASHSVVMEFGIGVLIGSAYCQGYRVGRQLGLALLVPGLLLLTIVPGFTGHVEEARLFYYGIPASMIVAAVALTRNFDRARIHRPYVELGEISYSTYLVHPFIVGAMALLFKKSGLVFMLDPIVLMLAYAGATVLISLSVSYFVHYWFDYPVSRALRGGVKSFAPEGKKISSLSNEPRMNS